MFLVILKLDSDSFRNLLKPIFVFSKVRTLLKMIINSTFKLNYSSSNYKLRRWTTYFLLAIRANGYKVDKPAFIFIVKVIFLASLLYNISASSGLFTIFPQVRRLLAVEGKNWYIFIIIRASLGSIHLFSFLRLIINLFFIINMFTLFKIKT